MKHQERKNGARTAAVPARSPGARAAGASDRRVGLDVAALIAAWSWLIARRRLRRAGAIVARSLVALVAAASIALVMVPRAAAAPTAGVTAADPTQTKLDALLNGQSTLATAIDYVRAVSVTTQGRVNDLWYYTRPAVTDIQTKVNGLVTALDYVRAVTVTNQERIGWVYTGNQNIATAVGDVNSIVVANQQRTDRNWTTIQSTGTLATEIKAIEIANQQRIDANGGRLITIGTQNAHMADAMALLDDQLEDGISSLSLLIEGVEAGGDTAALAAELSAIRLQIAAPECSDTAPPSNNPWLMWVPTAADDCAVTQAGQARQFDRVIRGLEEVATSGDDSAGLGEVKDAVQGLGGLIESGIGDLVETIGNLGGGAGAGWLPVVAGALPRVTAWSDALTCLQAAVTGVGSSDPGCSAGPSISIPMTTVTWSPLAWCYEAVGFDKWRNLVGAFVVLAGALAGLRSTLAALGMAASVGNQMARAGGER